MGVCDEEAVSFDREPGSRGRILFTTKRTKQRSSSSLTKQLPPAQAVRVCVCEVQRHESWNSRDFRKVTITRLCSVKSVGHDTSRASFDLLWACNFQHLEFDAEREFCVGCPKILGTVNYFRKSSTQRNRTWQLL